MDNLKTTYEWLWGGGESNFMYVSSVHRTNQKCPYKYRSLPQASADDSLVSSCRPKKKKKKSTVYYTIMDNTHINYHFTALAGSNLCENLQNEGLSDIPGQVPHIPADKGKEMEG